MASCSGHSFFVLWYSHTKFGTWVYHHGMMCNIHSWPLYDLDLWPQYHQNYIFTMNLCMGKTVFPLWHRHTKLWHGCIAMGQHVWTRCLPSVVFGISNKIFFVYLWPLSYLWPWPLINIGIWYRLPMFGVWVSLNLSPEGIVRYTPTPLLSSKLQESYL